MEDRTETSLIALRRILRATELNARTLARATGLTTPQLIVLEIVVAAGRATPKDIAGKAGVGQATATSLVPRPTRSRRLFPSSFRPCPTGSRA